jgi:hypothetical protein
MFPKDSPWTPMEQQTKIDPNPVSPDVETGRPVPFKDLERWYQVLSDACVYYGDDEKLEDLRDEIYALLRG